MSSCVNAGFEVAFIDSDRKETWIPFRDAHHDAIEISHHFSTRSGRSRKHHDLGLVGFGEAMNCIGKSYEIAFTVINDTDILQKIDGSQN